MQEAMSVFLKRETTTLKLILVILNASQKNIIQVFNHMDIYASYLFREDW